MFHITIRDVNSPGNRIPGTRVAIPGSRSRLSISPEYIYFYLRDRSWITGGGAKGGAITDRTRRCSRPMTGPHCRLRMIDIAGGGTPKTAGGGYRGARPGSFAGLTKSYKSEIFVHLHTGFFTGWMSLLSPRHQ